MKKIKKTVAVCVAALMLATTVACMAACGGTKLPEGSYKGAYTCEYTVGDTSKWGFDAEFGVDADNLIWDLKLTNPEGYAGSVGMLPWDQAKFTEQFSGVFTVDELMKIEVAVNDAGYPQGTDCIKSDKDVVVIVGYEAGCALALLAMQNAVNAALA